MELDRKTLEYISNKIADLEAKDFDLYGVNDGYGRGKNMAYREMMRILSDILSPIYYEEDHRKRSKY